MSGVIVFLTIFLSLYGGLHLYAFIKVRQALHPGAGQSVALAAGMVVFIVSPLLVRWTEKAGHESIARALAFVGYTWMGLVFLFASVSFALDLYRLLLALLRWALRSELSGMALSQRHGFMISLLLVAGIGLYGLFEALTIRTEHVTIKTPKIPPSAGPIRIVQISDVHLGLIVGKMRLERILAKVKAAEPDLFISTGDLVDGQMDDISTLARMIREIPAPYGKYAVTGNHEYYAGLDRSLEFTRAAGFHVLRDEAVRINDYLTIAGVDDTTGAQRYGIAPKVSEKALLSGLSGQGFRLFLKHRPLLEKEAAGLFDLQVSGHVHKGQIFPFGLVVRCFYPKDAGFLRLEKNSGLYVSRGSGTWGPPIRFLSPPEVTVIELVHDGAGLSRLRPAGSATQKPRSSSAQDRREQ